MARIFLPLLLLSTLYGSANAFSSDTIALILPLKSPDFANAAQAVLEGFFAAAKFSPEKTVRIYPLADEKKEIVGVYRTALSEGADVVVGPLTRDGVAALAASDALKVPTLTLNGVDHPPAKLYFFGLQIESAARQVAQQAYADGKRKAYVLAGDENIFRRIFRAFSDEWIKLGGKIEETPVASLDAIGNIPADNASMVFLCLDSDRARLLRPLLSSDAAIYSTFLVFEDDEKLDSALEGVRFADIPWLVQQDHPAVMVYPHPQGKGADYQRQYAIGIDAYRLASHIEQTKLPGAIDGVTGAISFEERRFSPKLLPAVIRQGKIQAIAADGH